MKTEALPGIARPEAEPNADGEEHSARVRLTHGGLGVGGGGWLVGAVRRHPVVAGAGIGLLWGLSMRFWMRYISTSPEFSWAGTLYILGAAVVAGSMLGLARYRRLTGGAGWWRLSILTLLLLGAGGAVMWQSVILLGFAIGRRRPWWLVVPLAAAGVAAQIPVLNEALVENWRFGTTEMVVAGIWYAPMLLLDVWAFSVAFAPSLADPKPGRLRQALMAAPVVVVSALALLVVGGMG